MPSFADVYNNAPPPSVHSTRANNKSLHPTSSSHIPADAKPLDYRRMSSSKAGMGRTRGPERSSKPEEAPVGPEFAERTRTQSTGEISDGNGSSPLGSPSTSPTAKRSVFGAFERRRASSGSPRNSTVDDTPRNATPGTNTATSPVADKHDLTVPDENRGERRGSISNFFKKVF
jgi:hypothetical protein